LKLLIVHYHLRPGGIRRIIELATPFLQAELGADMQEVILVTGEANDLVWNLEFQRSLRPVPVRIEVCPSLNYLSEQGISPAALRNELRRVVRRLICPSAEWLVWMHNPAVGRNLILTQELVRACQRSKASIVFHHHDWWFDNRWKRWPEMRRCGFRTRQQIAKAVFPAGRNIRHVAINRSDATVLRSVLSHQSFWLPNLVSGVPLPSSKTQKSARKWLEGKVPLGKCPVWIVPCRLLRRKNLAEAILLSRWLQPEAWLISTGGVSSHQESEYAEKLKAAIRDNRWRVALGVLGQNQPGQPAVEALIAASDAVLMTSIQEGFGLPYLEAVAAMRPLIARQIPNVTPDLRALGFRFPQAYGEIWVTRDLFDLEAEGKRQHILFQHWRRNLPGSCWKHLSTPKWLAQESIPFSRLTLTAQIEVLKQPLEDSWKICQKLNPFLPRWRAQIRKDNLQVSNWPDRVGTFLDGPSYAKRLAAIFALRSATPKLTHRAELLQDRFIRAKLHVSNLFPLLWAEAT
jgi:glycosyltransferase involved in cell wall biosynthesis